MHRIVQKITEHARTIKKVALPHIVHMSQQQTVESMRAGIGIAEVIVWYKKGKVRPGDPAYLAPRIVTVQAPIYSRGGSTPVDGCLNIWYKVITKKDDNG